MQNNGTCLRKWIAGAGAIALLAGAGSAGAVTRPMVGALGVFNPSVAAPFLFEGGVAVFAKKQGVYPPTKGVVNVTAVGTQANTFVGRAVNLPANIMGKTGMGISGGKHRGFPAFPTVAQTTKTYRTDNNAATFMNGGGQLANCPGPGCNLNGLGTKIEFCPPQAQNLANPVPGVAANRAGNWDCTAYNNANTGPILTPVVNRAKRLVIKNAPGAPHFGGTLTLLHSQNQNVWRVRVQPSKTPMGANNPDAVVERSWMSVVNENWTPGRPNFEYNTIANANGPRIRALLNAGGEVAQTFGCTNMVGTVGVGKAFPGLPGPLGPFVPILGPGNNCGTNMTVVNAPGQGWGFKMTTGTISGSDFFPFSTETTANPLATPFNPRRVTATTMTPMGGTAPIPGFFFTRMGDDSVSGTGVNQVRNIVLLGGGIAVDPGSGNAYDRMSTLRMRLQVPEPAGALGLLVGAGALLGFAWRRR